MSAALRFLLPVATAVAATLYLATGVPHQLDLAPAATPGQTAEQAELARCVDGGRDADACLDESDGKALFVRADWLARADDARRGSHP